MSRVLAIMTCLAMLASAPHVFAQDGEEDTSAQVEQLSGEGAQAFKAKDYATAIERFEQAYALAKIPLLLYNIGRCYEAQESWDEAISYYKQYAVAEDVASEERKEALARVAKVEAKRAAQAKAKEDKEKDITPPPNVEPKPGPNPVSYVLLGTGGLAIAGGAVAGVLALGEQTKFQEAETASDKEAARNAGKTLAITADGLFIGGGALTIIGLIMVLTAPGEDPPQTTWTPVVTPDSAGVQMQWSF